MIKDSRKSSGADAPQAANEALPAQLELFKRAMSVRQALFHQEVRRAVRELGDTHPSVRKMKLGVKGAGRMLRALERREELARIKVPEIPEGGALLHGRVIDRQSGRGIEGIFVGAETEVGKTLNQLGKAETGVAGYFAIILDAKQLAELADTGIVLIVVTKEGDLVHRESAPVKVAPEAEAFSKLVVAEQTPPEARSPKTSPKQF